MTDESPPKKSDALEVRIDHATKRAFMEECRKDGLSASEKVREMIDRFLAARRNAGAASMSQDKPSRRSRLKIAASAIAAMGGIALIGLQAGQARDISRAIFDRKDSDQNERLTLDEFLPDFSEAITSRSLGEKCRDALIAHASGVETGFFRTLDSDASGDLTPEEFARNQALPTEEMLHAEFKRGDKDGDGFISWAEHEAMSAPPDIDALKDGETPAGGGRMIAMEFDRRDGDEKREILGAPNLEGEGEIVEIHKIVKRKGEAGHEDETIEKGIGGEGEVVEIRKVVKREGGKPGDEIVEKEIVGEDGMFAMDAPSPEKLGPVGEACMPEGGQRADVVFFIGKPKLSSAAFQDSDVNRDGKLSFEEFAGG